MEPGSLARATSALNHLAICPSQNATLGVVKSLFTMWILGSELWSSGLAEVPLSPWALLPAQPPCFWGMGFKMHWEFKKKHSEEFPSVRWLLRIMNWHLVIKRRSDTKTGCFSLALKAETPAFLYVPSSTLSILQSFLNTKLPPSWRSSVLLQSWRLCSGVWCPPDMYKTWGSIPSSAAGGSPTQLIFSPTSSSAQILYA